MKDKTKVRSRVIVTNVTEQEFHEIIKAAGKMDLSFSSFLREAALILARQKLHN